MICHFEVSLLQPGCFEPNRGSTVFSRPGRFGKYQRCPPPQGLSCWRGKSSGKKGRGKIGRGREEGKGIKGKGKGKGGKKGREKGKVKEKRG